MTWTYKEYQSGNLDYKRLQLDDKVEFFLPRNGSSLVKDIQLIFIVYSSCLVSGNQYNLTVPLQFRDTSAIFNYLNFSRTDKECFCTKAYGYKPYVGSSWPPCKNSDFPALTRLVKALYDELSKVYAKNGLDLSFIDKEIVETNNNKFNNGKTIKITTVTPKIIRGEERRGCSISGKTGRINITGGSLSYSEILA